MAEMKNAAPGISREETLGQNPAAEISTVSDLEDLRPRREYVQAKCEYEEGKYRNKELGKKISDLDHSLCVMNNHTQHLQQKNEELDSEIDKILWSQNQAKLTLASQQAFQYGINQTMERYKAQVRNADNEVDSCDEKFKRRQALIERIYSMKKELQEKKKETEQNELQASKIERENVIMRKRNQAMLVRLGRQHQEAELRHQQILDKLTNLRERLKTNAANIDQGNKSNKRLRRIH
jgi:chromosome segregation ATPase